jgi:hypothetical protein
MNIDFFDHNNYRIIGSRASVMSIFITPFPECDGEEDDEQPDTEAAIIYAIAVINNIAPE